MKWKWTYFAAAVILAAYFLINAGAPPLAIAVGIGFAAWLTRRASRHA